MIYTVSRRTDVPAFFWEWFLRRLDAGYVRVRNPRFHESVSEYDLTPEVCDGFSFLSKNYAPALDGVDGLRSLSSIVEDWDVTEFSYTITPYRELERGTPSLETTIATLGRLRDVVGSQRIRWLLAPILMVDGLYDVDYHISFIDWAVPRLAGSVRSCMPDGVRVYPHVGRRAPWVRPMTGSERDEVMGHLGDVAAREGLMLQCCPAASETLGRYGVVGEPCANREVLGDANGVELVRGSREACGCVTMRDVGSYVPCPHMCDYCYAHPVRDGDAAPSFDVFSDMLCDSHQDGDIMHHAKAMRYVGRTLT